MISTATPARRPTPPAWVILVTVLVALPTLAMVMVIVRRILITRIYEGQGFRRTTRERPLVLRLPAPGGGVLVPSGPPIDVISIAEHTTAAKRSA